MRFTSLTTDNIVFNEYNNRAIKVEPLQFQIPRMYMPFGVSGFTPPYGPVKYNIDFSMKGWNVTDSYVNKFYDFLKNVEDKVIDYVETISEDIFGASLSRDKLVELFNSNIKFSANPNHDPKFRLKVSDKTKFYDVSENELTEPLDEGLYKGKTGAAFVQFGNIYFFNKRFGITWSIDQVKIYEPQRIHGCSFKDEDFDDDEEVVTKMSGFQFKGSDTK
jgi:hypothetical protein